MPEHKRQASQWDRRTFLKSTGVLAAGMAVVPIVPSEFQIDNGLIRVSYDAATGLWDIASLKNGDEHITGNRLGVKFSKIPVRSTDTCQRHAEQEEGSDGLGRYRRLKVTHRGLPYLEKLVWSATLRPGLPYAVIQAAVRLKPDAPSPVRTIELVNCLDRSHLKFGSAPETWMCFRDSGNQGGTDVTAMFKKEEQSSQSHRATVAIHEPSTGRTLLVGWSSWIASNPRIDLAANKTGGLTSLDACCDYYENAVSTNVATEPLLIGFSSDPLVALEQYAREVREANHPPIRKDTVMAWLSWYCARLKMTEQFVVDNAQIVTDHFRAYGVDTIQVDHGWQYKDLVGNWVHNEKFPHGMKWLGEELEKRGLSLGIWMAVGEVSEFVPFAAEHPDALIHDSKGRLIGREWFFKPHGQEYDLDPTHPAAQAHYRRSLGHLMDAGCRYYKIDFIGNSGNMMGVFHDPNRPRGIPMARYEMEQIRKIIGPNSWLRYCSSPTDTYCGIVNIGGATLDIDNARGNWEQNRQYQRQLGSCWYKHRTFWHNEPDALIVGEGEINEARVRCAGWSSAEASWPWATT